MHEPKLPFTVINNAWCIITNVIFAMQDMLATLAGIYINTLMNTIAWHPA